MVTIRGNVSINLSSFVFALSPVCVAPSDVHQLHDGSLSQLFSVFSSCPRG